MKLLMIVDSPTKHTGFALVGRELARRWHNRCPLEVWGIGHDGWPHEYPYRIYPGGYEWWAADNMVRLLNLIATGNYTHVWVLQDTFMMAPHARNLRRACDMAKAKLIYYYPVDAPPAEGWMTLVRLADEIVTYTEYGAEQTKRVIARTPKIIAHGVNMDVFRPVTANEFAAWRAAGAVILLNVNRHERRKALWHSLQLTAMIRERGLDARIWLHAPCGNAPEDSHLDQIAEQIGLVRGEHWDCTSDTEFCEGLGQKPEAQLNLLYNSADLMVSTTLGEGWGLTLTEAAATGLPVVVGRHTSCAEIGERWNQMTGREQFLLMPLRPEAVLNVRDNSRLRYPMDLGATADRVVDWWRTTPVRRWSAPPPAVRQWLSWDRISEVWWKKVLDQ